MLVYVGSCVFAPPANPRIGTVDPRNPLVAPVRGTSDGNMRTLCTGNPGKSSQPREKQLGPAKVASPGKNSWPREKQSAPTKTASTDLAAPIHLQVGSPA